MKRLLIVPLLLLASAAALACGGYGSLTPEQLHRLAEQASAEDALGRGAAIARLRAVGPAGLDALLEAHSTWIGRYEADEVFRGDDLAAWQRITAAVDAVARQKDAHASKLYWFTDLDAAKTAAEDAGKPILSLRLLGNLDDELSCANSRFFRTVLYANDNVRRALREDFILHWSSERPVPVITIDFGDGRTLKRTITGNSVHYVLDPSGAVLDAIPGLLAPPVFLAQIRQAAALREWIPPEPSRTPSQRIYPLTPFHVAQAARLTAEWERALAIVGLEAGERSAAGRTAARVEFANHAATPHALDAAPIAISKRRAELPTIEALAPRIEALEHGATEFDWTRIAELYLESARLDAGSRRLMRSKCNGNEPFERVAGRFEQSIAADTAYNQLVLHRRIHERLAAPTGSPTPASVEALNTWVYGELFLTPRSDPWLGLLPEFTYAALPEGGVAVGAP